MKREKTIKEQLKEYIEDIVEEAERWEREYKSGCSDPCWSDGCNLNLVRNHVIYDKREILQLCEKNSLKVPNEYFIPTPNEIDSSYFAKPDSNRAKRIIKNDGLHVKKIDKKQFENQQLSFDGI